MGDKTGIQWTDATWNPIVGCSVVSPACTNCYAMAQAGRIQKMKPGSHYEGTTLDVNGKPIWTGVLRQAPDHILTAPMRWKRPRKIFVNSMSDLFHDAAPDEWIDKVFAIMALCPHHVFQVLTKRPKRMRDYIGTRAGDWMTVLPDAIGPGQLPITKHCVVAHIGETTADHRALYAAKLPHWPLPNVWIGVTAEDQPRAEERIPDLLMTSAAVRFVSVEPMLGPIELRRWMSAVSWVICGGESGPGARPLSMYWARSMRDQCADMNIPFFFKQWGEWIPGPQAIHLNGKTLTNFKVIDTPCEDQALGCFSFRVGKLRAGRLLDGVEHNVFPGLPL